MSLDLEVLVPDGVAVQARVVSVRAADASGQFGLLPGHEAFLTLLVPCVLSFREENGRERYTAADGGVLVVEKERVSVVTREAVTADRLEEVADAAAAMLEARRRTEQTARAEFAELQSSLLRELRKVEKRP
jgi:F-type H+-transporting ATPase subunit epsilon